MPGERWEKPVALDGLDLALAAGREVSLFLKDFRKLFCIYEPLFESQHQFESHVCLTRDLLY